MFEQISKNYTPTQFVLVMLINISIVVPNSFIALGEEFGWRAYLVPKLEKLLGLTPSLIIGGIIWGLWHAPFIYDGVKRIHRQLYC